MINPALFIYNYKISLRISEFTQAGFAVIYNGMTPKHRKLWGHIRELNLPLPAHDKGK